MFRSYDEMKLDPDYQPLRYVTEGDDDPDCSEDDDYDRFVENG